MPPATEFFRTGFFDIATTSSQPSSFKIGSGTPLAASRKSYSSEFGRLLEHVKMDITHPSRLFLKVTVIVLEFQKVA